MDGYCIPQCRDDQHCIHKMAPCVKDKGGVLVYRFFDDEVLAGQAEFSYVAEAPKSYSKEDKTFISVMVLTKQGHRDAVKDIEKLVSTSWV